MTDTKAPKDPTRSKADRRSERLAVELRRNLSRRKALSRARSAADAGVPAGADPKARGD
jgi:hypothetical protein